MYRILVAGCGYVGTRIGKYFHSKKQKVWGIVRSPERKVELEHAGIAPLICDFLKPETLTQLPQVHFAVISSSPRERTAEAYRKTYLEGIGNLLKAIQKNQKPDLIVYLSSTGVYRDFNGEWVDETTPPEPDTERGKILLEAEEQVLKSGLPAVIFRLAGIYGPGRNRIESVRAGEALDFGDEPDKYLNMIHVDDIVGAMPAIFNKAEPGSVYLGADDVPVKQSEFYAWLTHKLIPDQAHRLRQRAPDEKVGGKRLINTRLKLLGVLLKYPSYREGYGALLSGPGQ